MVVLLTKEEERTVPLEYPISDIGIDPPQDFVTFQLN